MGKNTPLGLECLKILISAESIYNPQSDIDSIRVQVQENDQA